MHVPHKVLMILQFAIGIRKGIQTHFLSESSYIAVCVTLQQHKLFKPTELICF